MSRSKHRAAPAGTGRQYALSRQKTRIQFQCARGGHVYWHDFARGPAARRITNEAILDRFVRYWGEQNGGISGVCPRCFAAGIRVPW